MSVHLACGYDWDLHGWDLKGKRRTCPDDPDWKPVTEKERERAGQARVRSDDAPEPDPEDDVVDCPEDPPGWWPL